MADSTLGFWGVGAEVPYTSKIALHAVADALVDQGTCATSIVDLVCLPPWLLVLDA